MIQELLPHNITTVVTNEKGGRQRSIAILQFNITKNVNKKRRGPDNTALQHDMQHITITDHMRPCKRIEEASVEAA
jgi:hypothetical protein